MQLCRTKFRKCFILSTKNWIKCFPWKNPVDSREKSGDITRNEIDVNDDVNDMFLKNQICLKYCFFVWISDDDA